jgi:hypothetical protein
MYISFLNEKLFVSMCYRIKTFQKPFIFFKREQTFTRTVSKDFRSLLGMGRLKRESSAIQKSCYCFLIDSVLGSIFRQSDNHMFSYRQCCGAENISFGSVSSFHKVSVPTTASNCEHNFSYIGKSNTSW